MTKPLLVIYGNGQMARMLLSFFSERFDVVAFAVDRTVIVEHTLESLPVIPFDEIESVFPPENHRMIIAVGYLEMNDLRARKYEEAKAKGYRFENYIHPSVVQHPNVNMGENNVLLDHVSIHPNSSLGNSNFISSNASIGHGCRIGNNCWINAGVSIGGETEIGDNCFLGINATVGDNIELAERCYVGANTLVSRSTQAEEVHISASGERFPLPSADFLKFIGHRQS